MVRPTTSIRRTVERTAERAGETAPARPIVRSLRRGSAAPLQVELAFGRSSTSSSACPTRPA
jgi:hypothetical protein